LPNIKLAEIEFLQNYVKEVAP